MSVLKEFIKKHMKTETVVLCPELNELIWANGAKNPPGKVEVIAIKGDFGGSEKTLVNLLSVGVEEQLNLYATAVPKVEKEDKETKEEKSEVKEAEAKEIEKKEEPKEAKAEEKTVKKTPAKKATKKEVKKDE